MKKMRIIIDILMLIVLLFVYNVAISGVLIHEILGILIWVLFFIHLGLNFKWIKTITKKFNSGIKRETKQIYIVDLLLFIDFIIITITGVGISQYLFTFLNVNDIYLFTSLHELASYISVLLIGIHMIMHFKFFNNSFNKLFNDKNKSKIFTYIFIIVSILLIGISSISLKVKDIFVTKIDETKYSGEVIDESSDTTNSSTVTTEDTSTTSTDSTVEEDTTTSDTASVTETEVDKPTLLDYLGSLVCTGCSRRCPLSHPQCGRGDAYVKEATADYNEMYS